MLSVLSVALVCMYVYADAKLFVQVKAVSAAMTSDQAKRLLGKVARKWAPTAVGLGVIPLIVHPIDHAVTLGMDETVRKWLA